MKPTKLLFNLINSKPQTTEFSLVDSAIFDLYNSTIFDGVWYSKKSQPRKIIISKNFKVLLGYTPEHEVYWDTILHPDDRSKFIKHLSAYNDKGEIGVHDDLRMIHKSGEILWMQCQFYSKSNLGQKHQFIFVAFKDISIKKNAELELLDRHKSTHEILSHSSIGTWQSNLITGKSVCDESLAHIIGYSVEELNRFTVDDWHSLTHPDDVIKSRQFIEEHIATKSPCFIGEARMKHRNGNWIWVATIGKVSHYTRNNEPQTLEGILYEITDSKNSELQLQKYKDLLEEVNKVAEIGVWEIHLDSNKVYWSAEIKKMLGVSSDFEPSIEEAVSYFREGASREKIIESVQNAIEKGQNYDIEVEAVLKNNKYIWTRAIGVSEYYEGKCTRLFGFLQNIHCKTIASKKLAFKEELFHSTFSHAPVGMAIIDVKGNIIQVNKNLYEILGYSKKELLNSNFNRFSHFEDKSISNSYIREVLDGKRESFKVDKRYIHKKGSIIWTQISVSAVKNESGEIIHFVVQIQDITDRKKNELLLTNYQDLLERSNYVAKIGSWEINIHDHTVTWSPSLRKILKTRDNLVPNFNDSIEYFAGNTPQKDVLKSVFNKALKEGANFDIEILVYPDGRKKQKWIRMIGVSEFSDGQCKRLYGLIQDIDDIKKVQLALATKEEQWRTTFNHAKAGMALINFDGMADSVNQSLCDLFGYSMKEMEHINIKSISLSEDLELHINLMENLINGKAQNFNDDLRFLHKNGHTIWANVSVSAVKNDYGKFTHMVAQLVDITESKTNQILLNKYKDSLERSNTIAKIGSWELDPETKHCYWSVNLGRLLGSRDTTSLAFSYSIMNYVPKKNQEYLTASIEDALLNGTNFDLEIQLKTKTGLRWMRIIGISEFENGSCKLLHGLVQDIHEFKTAQLEILLREEEFRQTFWHAPIGMGMMDLTGKVVKVNPSMCETFGYTEQELIHIEKNVISHPDDIEATKTFIQQILSGERESFQQEKRYFHKNKSLIWAILSISAVKNDLGETTHFVTQVNDITDKKLMTESLKEHNNRLQNYAHIVSHNLRSHTGNLAMLLELSEINNKKGCDNDLFEHIKSASNNMNETVQHLSEIVEIHNLLKETLVPHNLRKRVDKSIASVRATLNEINGEVTFNVDEDYLVYAVSSYMDSILHNLITNAIKYKSPYRLLKIKIKAGRKNGMTFLSIADNGLGIDLEKHGSKIFGMYKTFHEHKKAKGIGLFISKNQIEAMGGSIEVESKPNIGSTFTIYFKDEEN